MNTALPLGSRKVRPRNAVAQLRRSLALAAAFGLLVFYLVTMSGRELHWFSGGLQLSSGLAQPTAKAERLGPTTVTLRPLDPGAGFSQGQIGRLAFGSYNTDLCRHALFDNRTGALAEAGQAYCGVVPQLSSDHIGQERALNLLKSFRK